jgi:hypothetical protein
MNEQDRVVMLNQLLPSAAEANLPVAGSTDQRALIAGARQLAWLSFWDILVFFGVLLVGFAYLWKRGDLDWVRSTAAEKAIERGRELAAQPAQAEALVGAGH